MQFLCELLEIKEQADFFDGFDMELFESLGALNLVNKRFLNLLRKQTMYWNHKAGKNPTPPVRDDIGQNSKIDTHVETNPNQMWERFNDNAKVVALIVSYDTTQVMAIVKSGERGRSGAPEYSILVDPQFFKIAGMTKADYEKAIGNMGREYSSGDFRIDRLVSGIKSGSVTGKIRKFIKIVLDQAKKQGLEVKSMLVMKDEARATKAAERAKSKVGATAPKGAPTQDRRGRGDPKAFEDVSTAWTRAMKGDLRTRLDRYKTNKADSVETVQDMLAKIITDGFLDKIKVAGYNYRIGNERIYLRELKKKQSGKDQNQWDVPSIEYEYDSSASGAAKEAFKKFHDEATKKGLKYSDPEYREMSMKMLPPRKLLVTLKLDGGKIVPDTVESSLDPAYEY